MEKLNREKNFVTLPRFNLFVEVNTYRLSNGFLLKIFSRGYELRLYARERTVVDYNTNEIEAGKCWRKCRS